MLDLTTLQILVSRDVIFCETMFPFQSNNLNHTNEHLPTQISENRSPASDKFSPNPDTFSSSTSTELPSEISFSGSETN